jgi:hypothetical protein
MIRRTKIEAVGFSLLKKMLELREKYHARNRPTTFLSFTTLVVGSNKKVKREATKKYTGKRACRGPALIFYHWCALSGVWSGGP